MTRVYPGNTQCEPYHVLLALLCGVLPTLMLAAAVTLTPPSRLDLNYLEQPSHLSTRSSCGEWAGTCDAILPTLNCCKQFSTDN
jgi:hypothetical protein